MSKKRYFSPVILGLTDEGDGEGEGTGGGTGVGPISDKKANQILTPQEFTTPSDVLDNELGLDGQAFGL